MHFQLPALNLLTQQMKNLVEFPLTKTLLVLGSPGTGKSVIALHRMKYLAGQCKQVVLLCFNNLLQETLQSEIQHVKTVNSFYGTIKHKVFGEIKEGNMITDPNINIDEVQNIFHSYVKKHGKYDAILIDEAQDLSIEIIKSLHILTQHLSIFADPNQPLSDPCCDSDDIITSFSDIHVETLERNYRNTKQIYQFAANQFMPGNELANNKNLTRSSEDDPSSEPQYHQQLSRDQSIILTQEIIHQHNSKSIAIFCHNIDQVDKISDKLQNLGIENRKYHSQFNKNKNDPLSKHDILITTYQSAKGLEFDVVIIMVSKVVQNQEKLNQKLFVLSTRAKRRLYYLFDF